MPGMNLNLYILRMLEDTFSFDTAQLLTRMLKFGIHAMISSPLSDFNEINLLAQR